ncbi:uncharacterized protein LOC131064531 [Cryptomeria japonica]|uniref:uncharacterized protein LOC131064531 n=1 Tax=Cryptomeria japonica TaxID=3369 RepID=UPI0027DA2E45|nr:uncharacterized protein LOC131064531 [Cryptomeria japonica]
MVAGLPAAHSVDAGFPAAHVVDVGFPAAHIVVAGRLRATIAPRGRGGKHGRGGDKERRARRSIQQETVISFCDPKSNLRWIDQALIIRKARFYKYLHTYFSVHIAYIKCETILQPGLNCFVRVWKHPRKARHKPRSFSKLANAVVYTCNFCSHKNIKPGTPEGYLKKRKAQKALNAIQSTPIEKNCFKKADRRNVMSSMSISSPSPGSTPITPTSANLSSTKKRKRKAWSTLQELTNSNQKSPSFSNLCALKIHSFSL